jgi:hypothetical protein
MVAGRRQALWAVRAGAALGLGAMLLTGCGTASPAPGAGGAHLRDVRQLVDAVAARQRADGTAKLTLRGEITGAAAQRFTGDGVLRVGGDGVAVRFTQVVTRKGAAPEETGLVVLPGQAFLRHGPDGKAWTKLDPGSADPDARRWTAMASSLSDSADPTATLARYADATSITDATDDVVDGDPAVRYTIVLDLARAAAAETDPAARQRLEEQVRGGLTRVTSTLWVDPQDRPIRTAVRQDLPGVGTLDLLGTYRDWGRPVDIEPPPAADVRGG